MTVAIPSAIQIPNAIGLYIFGSFLIQIIAGIKIAMIVRAIPANPNAFTNKFLFTKVTIIGIKKTKKELKNLLCTLKVSLRNSSTKSNIVVETPKRDVRIASIIKKFMLLLKDSDLTLLLSNSIKFDKVNHIAAKNKCHQ